jgi:hypothetical protein
MRGNDYSTEGIKDKKDEVRDVERWLTGENGGERSGTKEARR